MGNTNQTAGTDAVADTNVTVSADTSNQAGIAEKAIPPVSMSPKQIRSQVIRIALPALVELSLMQLASMVDTMMVGQLGPWAISAVGYCTQPRFLLMAVFIALNTGATALISRSVGEGNKEQANRVLQTSVMITFSLAVIIAVFGFFASETMVRFMGANGEGADGAQILDGATAYMRVQMAGFPFAAMAMSVTASKPVPKSIVTPFC